jgi:hypothetical protein
LILLELKAARQITEEHEAQLLNYLKSTRIEVGLLLNFGPKPAHYRKIYDNSLKGARTWVAKDNQFLFSDRANLFDTCTSPQVLVSV